MSKPFVLVLLASSPAFADARLDGRVTDAGGQPVAGATVVIEGGGALHEVITGADGRYHVALRGSGAYAVTFVSGDSLTTGKVTVAEDGAAILDGKLVTRGGEVIVIHDRQQPKFAKPVNDPDILPPYSDEAILTDTWAKAWLFLDVSETGEVTRLKFLKRPGVELDEIALEEAFKTRFEPARDGLARPVESFVGWPIEWPAWGWMVDRVGKVTRKPSTDPMVRAMRGEPNLRAVPCRGSGPLNLGSIHPVYRDCSVPDLSHANASEKWISAPSK